jgi:pimeloyl-ACP methyl ester carboxylesterase
MNTVVSSDGTVIAYDRVGTGPALVLVDGALCTRTAGPNVALAGLLASRFTVYTYDRRGRGDSGDSGGTAPYSVEKEIDDLAAVLAQTGGTAGLYGISSGAALALEAVGRGLPVTKLALYEAPYVVDDTRPPVPDDFATQLQNLVEADRPGEAVKLFLTTGTQVPAVFVTLMRVLPAWPRLKALAHTLPYDIAVMGDRQAGAPFPADSWARATATTLVICGSKSPAWMRNAMRALADVLPEARHHTLQGQTHLVKPKALAPVLLAFFDQHPDADPVADDGAPTRKQT